MAGPRDYSSGTRAALAALSGGACYFPGCSQSIIRFIDGEPFIDYQIAHIRDANPGNRFDGLMTDDQRRAFSNLILLCKPHHELIDKRHPERFDSKTLLEWKSARESMLAGSGLDEVDEGHLEAALRASAIEVRVQGDLYVGGLGGAAPGAGGGGGGVIGLGTGGPGGAGAPLVVDDRQEIHLDGGPASAPGAGGAGGGVLVAGSMVRLGASPHDQGQGFSDGVDGGSGGDTTFGPFVARGGRGGLAGTGQRRVDGSIGISALILVNYVETQRGLAYVMGGGWSEYSALNLPHNTVLPVLVQIEAGDNEPGEYTLSVVVRDPSRTEQARLSFPVTVERRGRILRILRPVGVPIRIDEFGVWTVCVEREGLAISEIALLVRRVGEG